MSRPRVLRLPEHVANQIAAGEVVARPASVVKELVENAMDAGATAITVAIEEGGTKLVRVVDDGHGMDREDAEASLERHATSKLRSPADLLTLRTLGFRGEALPSIASVSRFRLRTRAMGADEAVELSGEGDGAIAVRPCGAATGTTVEVRDLFFNVPARRKFLRATATEAAHVSEVVREAALAHPEVQFELWRDGRRHRTWLRAQNREERARDAIGGGLAIVVLERRGPLAIEAYLTGPDRVTNGATGLTFLVNQRPVEDRALARAVAAAYGELLERGQYPLGVVHLDLPAEACDVNVHPQKAEVRFAEPRAVCDAVRSSIAAHVSPIARRHEAFDPTTGEVVPSPSFAPARHDIDGRARSSFRPYEHTREPVAAWTWPSTTNEARTTADARPLETPTSRPTPASRYLGEVGAVLIALTPRGVAFVDRAAARARVLDHRARSVLERGALAPRRLVFPLRLEVTADAAKAAELVAAHLELLGFDIHSTGPRTLAVHAVAELFGDLSAEKLVHLALARHASLADATGREAFVRAAGELYQGEGALGSAAGEALLAAWLTALGDLEPRDAPEVRAFVTASIYNHHEGRDR